VDIELHTKQELVFHHHARYKIVAAGRRFGKSYLAAILLFVEASKDTMTRSDGVVIDLILEKVYYVAPTFTQGKEIMWPVLKSLGADLIEQAYENEAMVRLHNGRTIHIKGADRPDSLRGTGLSYVVLDEYAFMKEEVWEMIISPQLARSEGGALFIGTPDGKNHFYDLYQMGLDEHEEDWASWNFKSADNPYLPAAEIDKARRRMSTERFMQEMEASFEGGGGLIMTRDMFEIVDELPYGDDYLACDLAGFQPTEGGRKLKRLDDHALATVRNHKGGWCIRDIQFGQWDTRETAIRIVKSVRDVRPLAMGIEKGMSRNAVLPYLTDEMHRKGIYFTVEDLTHGNQNKTDRITWALQGRADKGRIQLLRGDWNETFLQQAIDFPSKLSHDDLIDAVAYIDQLADPWFDEDSIDLPEWEPLDEISGY